MSDVRVVSTSERVIVATTEHKVTTVQVGVQGPAGPSDHGGLSGLSDDDHPQYHNNARGDARYTPLAHASDTANPHAVTKAQVGLGNVDNTSDVNKPVSTAQAAADAAVLAAAEPIGTAASTVSAHAAGVGVHAIASVTGLQTALDAKSSTSHDHAAVYAPIAKGVTNGDAHNHNGGDGAQITYADLSGLPTLGTAAATNATAYESAGSTATHAALTTTHGISTYGATLVDDADATTARSTLGLGNAATRNVGTTSGTVAAGDDARLSDARTPVGHTHATGDVTGFNAAALAAAPAETTSTVGTLISGATEKTTPVDADSLGLSDSAASGVLKKLTWANLKAWFNGVFARLSGIAGGQTLIGGTGATDSLTLQATSASGTAGTDKAVRVLVGDTGATEAITLLQSGYIGVGQQAPQYPVDIGSATRRVQIDASGNIGYGSPPGAIAVGGGTTTYPCAHAVTELNNTATSGTRINSGSRIVANPASTSTADFRSAYFYAQTHADCSLSVGGLIAFMAEARHYGTGVLGSLYGCYSTAKNYGSGQITLLAGTISSTANNGAGNVITQYGCNQSSTNDSTGNITTNYGIMLTAGNASAVGSITTNITQLSTARKTAAGNITTNVGHAIRCSNAHASGSITTNIGLEIGGSNSAWSNSGTVTTNTALLIGNSTNFGTNKKAIDCQSTADSAFAGKLGIGNSAPTAKLDVMATTGQLRLGYDATYFADFTVNSAGALKIAAPLSWMPAASATPASNGDLTVEATSNTSLTLKLKGSDGTVRSVSLELA